MDDSILIEAVRSKPEIYDKGHAGFKNPAIKDAAWLTIATIVNATSSDCSARWHTLRERYCKEKRLAEQECRSGAGAPGRPPWAHTSAMSFLDPHIRKRKSIDSLPPPARPVSALSQPSPSPTPSTSSTDEDSLLLHVADLSGESSLDVIEMSVDDPGHPPFTVLASCPPLPPSTSQGTSSSSASSLPYLGPTGRCKKQKKDDETAEMFKVTLENLNKSLSAPPETPAAANDADALIGRGVEAALKMLPTAALKLEYRKKFRALMQECEEQGMV